MKRWQRILLECAGPPAIAALLLFMLLVAAELPKFPVDRPWGLVRSLLSYLLLYLMFAYLIAGAPSLLYAAFMEWRFSCGLNPASWRAVGLAALSGLVAGVGMVSSMQLIFGSDGTGSEPWVYGVLGALGFVVGAIVGLIIRWIERHRQWRVA